MGLGEVMGHVAWALVALVVVGTAANAAYAHFEDVDDARRQRLEQREQRLLTRLSSATFCHNAVADEVYVTALNAGNAPLDIEHATLLLDGTVAAFTASGSGDLWAPGEERVLTVAGVADAPDRGVLVTDTGVLLHLERTTCRVLTTIVVAPNVASMDIGEARTFTATGFDQFGDPFDGRPYAWSSAAGALTTLGPDSAQLVAGTTSGTFLVTATSGSASGAATVTVHPGAPVSIAVTPDPASVAAGGTQAFTATLLDAFGNANTTTPVSWSTNAGSISAGGILTAQTTAQAGRSVTATAGALSDAATVNVVAGPVARVAVTPSSATVLTNDPQSFTATAYDAYDNVVTGATFAWSATRGSVTNGAYTAPATVGADTVTATASGVSGQASVTVRREVHVSVMQTYKANVASSAFLRGDTVETRVTLVDHDGLPVQGASVTIQLANDQGAVQFTGSGTTSASGVASISHTLAQGARKGTWTDAVTAVSGTDLVYVPAQNVVTQVTFTVD